MSTRELRCPSCDGTMQQVERRGVMIDLCRDCRGVYLDRGELDKLLEAAAAHEPATPLAEEADRLERRRTGDGDRYRRDDDDYGRYRRDDDDDDHYEGDRGRGRRKGWLGDILDFD